MAVENVDCMDSSLDIDDIRNKASNDSSNLSSLEVVEGFLYKWTNIITGWRHRFFVLDNFTLSYFLNRDDVDTECRGSFNLTKCKLELSKYDDCAFTLRTKTSTLHLKSDTCEDKKKWIIAIQKVQELSSSPTFSDVLSRSDSIVSFSSVGSVQSNNSALDKKELFNLDNRITEMHKFLEQIHSYVDSMQKYFDGFKDVFGHPETGIDFGDSEKDDNSSDDSVSYKSTQNLCETCALMKKIQLSTDFTGEAIAFRTVTSGLMATLTHSIESVASREIMWKKYYEKTSEKNKILSEKCRKLREQLVSGTYKDINAMKEGPEMVVTEEQFIDALDSTYEIEEKRSQAIAQLETSRKLDSTPKKTIVNPYKDMIKEKFKELSSFLTEEVKNDDSWSLCVNSHPTLVFKKFVVKDNIVLDPYRVTSLIKGVSAKELTNFFWDPKYRYEIDLYCAQVNILENFGDNCIVCHQLAKPIWPASQRDFCFVSQMKVCDSQLLESITNNINEHYTDLAPYSPIGLPYMVINFSVGHQSAVAKGVIRGTVDVGLLAQTYTYNKKRLKKSDRSEIFTKISYLATVNPGGWLPHAAVRTIAKRELAKFVETFGNYAQNKTADQSLLL